MSYKLASGENDIAIPLAFVSLWIASGLYVFVALLWLVPDHRIERVLVKREKGFAFSCLTRITLQQP